MSFDAAYAALKAQHLEGRVRRFPGSSATVALAAQELGTAEGAIAKTMAPWDQTALFWCLLPATERSTGGHSNALFTLSPSLCREPMSKRSSDTHPAASVRLAGVTASLCGLIGRSSVTPKYGRPAAMTLQACV